MRTAGQIALAAGVFALALVAAELGHRAWRRAAGRPHDASVVRQSFGNYLERGPSGVPALAGRKPRTEGIHSARVIHPYHGSEESHDPDGVLGYFRARPRDEYAVVVVGGSVAAGFAALRGRDLAAAIEADPRFAGRRVRVLNYSHFAYRQPQQLARVLYLLALGGTPDAVIELDGYNELTLDLERSHPAYPTDPVWGHLVSGPAESDPQEIELFAELWDLRGAGVGLVRTTLALGLERSSLWSHFVLQRVRGGARRRGEIQAELLARTNARLDAVSRYQADGPVWKEGFDGLIDACVGTWIEGSVSLDAVCRSRGIAYLHVLQPTLFDAGSKPLSAEELALRPAGSGYRPAIEAGYPRMRERSRALRERGIAFVDASRAFEHVEEQLYFDECHFYDRGNELLVPILARALLASLPGAPSAGGER